MDPLKRKMCTTQLAHIRDVTSQLHVIQILPVQSQVFVCSSIKYITINLQMIVSTFLLTIFDKYNHNFTNICDKNVTQRQRTTCCMKIFSSYMSTWKTPQDIQDFFSRPHKSSIPQYDEQQHTFRHRFCTSLLTQIAVDSALKYHRIRKIPNFRGL